MRESKMLQLHVPWCSRCCSIELGILSSSTLGSVLGPLLALRALPYRVCELRHSLGRVLPTAVHPPCNLKRTHSCARLAGVRVFVVVFTVICVAREKPFRNQVLNRPVHELCLGVSKQLRRARAYAANFAIAVRDRNRVRRNIKWVL